MNLNSGINVVKAELLWGFVGMDFFLKFNDGYGEEFIIRSLHFLSKASRENKNFLLVPDTIFCFSE